MSSSLSGGTNTLNFNVVKKSSTLTSLNSSSNSPSSTLTISEPSNNISQSQSAIRTKRPRTTRKRPNQNYNEAATLLSEAYPNLFRNLKKLPPPCKFTKPLITECYSNDFLEPLLLPLNGNAFQLKNKSDFQTEFFSVREKEISEEIISSGVENSDEVLERDSGDEFDCKSILEDEIEEGIDSIIGTRVDDGGSSGGGGLCYGGGGRVSPSPWFGRFGGKLRALRHVGDVNMLNFAMVDILEISPGLKKMPLPPPPVTEKKKQRKKVNVEERNLSLALPLRLKLNYADVRSLWSERGLPFRR
ncbi:hypothetical protein TSUD_376640 [Trifolium subterraneum]|uniref:Uncharacterized protein n=1 Tax=Trifolium subterraneum TaxID=3900 RepID=A0A2Z6PGH0_TRISU|nr:hypothetical protein TSUD_376640 [Trifolium subterraneum]